jgi:hypothetical protein
MYQLRKLAVRGSMRDLVVFGCGSSISLCWWGPIPTATASKQTHEMIAHHIWLTFLVAQQRKKFMFSLMV